MLRTRLLPGGLLLLLVGCAAVLLYLLRVRLPAPDGPYPVGTRLLYVTDPARGGRELAVQIWYPAARAGGTRARYARWAELGPARKYLALIRTDSWLDAPVAEAGAPFPVLLYGHRWGGERTQNTSLAQELASQGYVVAAVDHPGNSSRMELSKGTVVRGAEDMDGPEPDSAAARIAFWNRTLQVWTADDELVLDRLTTLDHTAGDPFAGRLEISRVGAFGHSFGGSAALRLCGEDPRVVAAVNLDGYTFGALRDRTERQQVMILYEEATGRRRSSAGVDNSMDGQLDRADRAAVESNVARFGGIVRVLPGMQHMDFSDLPLLPPFHRPGATGPIAPRSADAELRNLLVPFFRRALSDAPVQGFPTGPAPDPLQSPAPQPRASRAALSSVQSARGN